MWKSKNVQKVVYFLFKGYVRTVYIGKLVRAGTVPHGLLQGEVEKAVRATKPYGVLEMIGYLRLRVKSIITGEWTDYGLVSTKKVTTAFANYVVDSLQDSSGSPLDDFTYHDMGDDNSAEANTETALQNSRETRISGTDTENGAGIYQSVATINATAGYDVEEHGIFSAESAGTMMDRNLVPNAPTVISGDSVEFTYELSVNAES
jgi:hypothetical protein